MIQLIFTFTLFCFVVYGLYLLIINMNKQMAKYLIRGIILVLVASGLIAAFVSVF